MTPAAIQPAPPNFQTSIDKFVADLFTPERLKANPQGLLHSFLAKDAAQLVAPTLEKWKTDKSIADKINLQVTDYRLSPLHIAVLKGNHQAARILTEHGASLSSQDIHGCTPLHLAAMLQNQEMLQQLKETAEKTDRAALAVRNSSYDTFETLQESLQNPPKILPDRIVSYYAKDNSVKPLTAEAFKTLTKTAYCSTILTTREILWNRWQKLPKKVEPIDPEVQKALHEYHAHQPKLILGEEVAANGSFSIGLGVKAGESLTKGQIVRIFAGELDVDLDSKYAAGSEDGTIEPIRYGNEASRINDGFPNCGRISVGYKRYVIALEPIAQNEWLHDDYCIIHYNTKFGHYAVGDLKPLEQLATNFQALRPMAVTEKIPTLKQQMRYLFQTPYVMAHLLLRGKMHGLLIRDILREKHGLSFVGLDDITSNNAKVAKDFYLALSSLLEYLHRKPLRQEVLTYFQDLLVKQPVIVTIQHIEFLNSNKESLLKSRSSWDEYKKWVNTSVAIQGEIMDAAQGITRSDQIPAKIAQQLLTIFNTNAASLLEIQRQQPDLIPKCLAFGVSNEAAEVVIRLLNQFIRSIQTALSKAGANAS